MEEVVKRFLANQFFDLAVIVLLMCAIGWVVEWRSGEK